MRGCQEDSCFPSTSYLGIKVRHATSDHYRKHEGPTRHPFGDEKFSGDRAWHTHFHHPGWPQNCPGTGFRRTGGQDTNMCLMLTVTCWSPGSLFPMVESGDSTSRKEFSRGKTEVLSRVASPDQIKECLMHPGVVRKFWMERRRHYPSLPHGDGIVTFSGKHFYPGPDARNFRRTDEDHLNRRTHLFSKKLAFTNGAVNLASVGIA